MLTFTLVLVVVALMLVSRFPSREKDEHALVADFLRSHPGWHYRLDIAKACGVSRARIDIVLGELEDSGRIERRLEEPTWPWLRRTLYRAVVPVAR